MKDLFRAKTVRFSLTCGLLAAGICAARAQTTYTPYAITTLAGSAGNYGYVDDTGPAARFSYVYGVAVDSSGNVYVADSATNQASPSFGVVRKITPAGVTTTLAGQSGTGGTSDGTGTAATFGNIGGIAIDNSGNLFVTDRTNGSVRKIVIATRAVTTVVATGTFKNPVGIAVDSSGNLYVADTGNFVIRKISGGSVSTLAGTVGTQGFADGSSATFGLPNGIAVDGSGNVYVVDTIYNKIRKITAGGTVSTYAGQPGSQAPVDGSLSAARFYVPFGIAIDAAGNIFVTDTENSHGLIREISASGNVTTLAGNTVLSGSTDGTGSNARFYNPYGIAVGSSGTLTIADTGNYTVRQGTALTTATPPSIQTQPQGLSVNTGASVTFTVVATGTAPLSYQWTFGGGVITGATASSYTLTNAQTTNSGDYKVTVTNSAGFVTSNAATLTVAAGPAISAQPQSQTVNAGATTTLSVTATGVGLTYQWMLNGTAIAGATSSTLSISNTSATAAGSYTVVITDSSNNSLTSSAAILGVQTNARLVNLSMLTAIQDSLTVGFVVGGPAGSDTEPLLIRAVGPTLGAPVSSGGFAYPGVMPDPSLKVIRQSDSVTVASNTGWGNPPGNATQIRAADSATGAFPLLDPSLDSAVLKLLPAVGGGYTVQVSGSSGDSGSVIAEIYDNTQNYTVASPRLINLSSLKQIPAGGSMTLGFVINGSTSETVLIRAAGPALTGFGYPASAVMSDPKLVLQQQNPNTVMATNSGWGGSAQVSAAADSVKAFKFTDSSSKDSAILITLPPVSGGYSATVSSASGGGGNVIVEVYEVR